MMSKRPSIMRRRSEFNLARRFHAILNRALLEVTKPESQTLGECGREIGCSASPPAGLDHFKRLHPAILAVRDQVMAPLSGRERETLQDLLARVTNTNELKASRRFS